MAVDGERGGRAAAGSRVFTAERAKAFIDAVAAIAMTLLIIPLLDSINDSPAEQAAVGWFGDNWDQLVSFVVSFVVIAMFWIRHHQLFGTVERVTNPLLLLSAGWMLTIVWLPVATAMTGQMGPDPIVETTYIGTMVLTCVALLVTRLYLRAHPRLHSMGPEEIRAGLAGDVAMALLFATALLIAVLVPPIGYFSLYLLALTDPLMRVLLRLTRKRR